MTTTIVTNQNIGNKFDYTGHVVQGEPEGDGIAVYSATAMYMGQWKNGKRHGKGKYTDTNYEYDGMWLNDKKQGMGIQWRKHSDTSVDMYNGEWKNDMQDGKGVLQKQNYLFIGEWREGKKFGSGEETTPSYKYMGNFQYDCFYGQGTLQRLTDNSVYEGGFEFGAMHGIGKLKIDNELRYEGEFFKNQLHGYGTQYIDGCSFNGPFVNGKKQGYFIVGRQTLYTKYILRLPAKYNEMLKINFDNDKKEGKGELYSKYTVMYKFGVLQYQYKKNLKLGILFLSMPKGKLNFSVASRCYSRTNSLSELPGVLFDLAELNCFALQNSINFVNIDIKETLYQREYFAKIEEQFSLKSVHIHVVYYTGHGDKEGNWSTSNGFVTFESLIKLWKDSKAYQESAELIIVADCCYSGQWVAKLKQSDVNRVSIMASCKADEKSFDTTKGGAFTVEWLKMVKDPNYKPSMKNQHPMFYSSNADITSGEATRFAIHEKLWLAKDEFWI